MKICRRSFSQKSIDFMKLTKFDFSSYRNALSSKVSTRYNWYNLLNDNSEKKYGLILVGWAQKSANLIKKVKGLSNFEGVK